MSSIYIHNMAKVNDAVNFPSCFVCGCQKTGSHPLYIRQSGQPGPYFPFLETHEPPDGAELPTKCGKVLACYACYAFLIQQWESYEKNKIPLVKRIYWLKRVDNGPYTGVEMGMQSEYASQVFGLNADSQNQVEMKVSNSSFTETEANHLNTVTSPSLSTDGCFKDCITSNNSVISVDKKQDIQEEALDLSIERPKRKRKLPSFSTDEVEVKPIVEVVNISTGALDLSMPDKNASIEVCYFCGNQFQKGTLSDIYARNFDRYSPFFPSLVMHPRPNGSKPMEVSGKVSGCKDCLTFLVAQFNNFENLKIPYRLRIYTFLKCTSGTENYIYMCYKCGKMVDLSALKLVYIRPNSETKSYYPLLQLMPLKPGVIPVSPKGEIYVCNDCTGGLENESLTFKRSISAADWNLEYVEENSSQRIKLTESGSSYKLPSVSNYESDIGLDSVSCCLCHQNFSLKQMQTLSMVPDPSNSKEMFFPFLKFLPQVNKNMITEDGRILACKACYSHLSSQWLEYEKDDIPADQRHFSLRALSISSQSPRLTPHLTSGQSTPSERSTSTPPVNSPIIIPHMHHSQLSEDVKKTKCKSIEGYHGQSLKELEVVAVTTEESIVTLAAMTTQRALNININCYICGFYSKAGQTYSVKSKGNGKELFFPFLNKHISAHPEAAVDDSTYLVCMVCFHSLVVQWQHYEKGRIEYHARFYDTYNFSCLICGTKTYRKRLYLLTVKDYPFLKEHTCPSGGMVVNNGHSVVVCKDCYVSLNEQYTALERLGVPVEKRQYNWIQRPPPPEFSETIPGTIKLKANCFGQKGLSTGQQPVSSGVMPCTGGIGSCPKDISNSILQKNLKESLLHNVFSEHSTKTVINEEFAKKHYFSSSKAISPQKSCNAEERTRTSTPEDAIVPQTTSVQVD